MNGGTTEEASVVRPVSLHHRNTRLSFLNKRKPSESRRDSTHVNGDGGSPGSSHSRGISKDHFRRASFFRVQSGDQKRSTILEQALPSRERSHSEASTQDGHASDSAPSLGKRASVRKRLSMLGIGRKGNKQGGIMGSLDEE